MTVAIYEYTLLHYKSLPHISLVLSFSRRALLPSLAVFICEPAIARSLFCVPREFVRRSDSIEKLSNGSKAILISVESNCKANSGDS